ncbi:nitrous oxide reductase accessory protein NosL [Cupriavidus taiwanensis]|uniref:nitrous oxide reductase accessory protein NosL n=1 Tax=Cupriavidus taiwanensis TaxID=164546 RepID=UPI002540203D|nr:nitrous oxide reductase accessory protein NosL [Cupriavidus taiwanensis]MDK3026207.1 nitrous oxide reductase accessory protein NosL [Cupriavidus taiwanensis]
MCTHFSCHRRRLLLTLAGSAVLIAGCGRKPDVAAQPQEFDVATACSLDGMLLADYAGPKAQVFYAGEARPHWFCDTVEMFDALLSPEQQRPVRAAFVQDMARADWEQPRGHWFDATAGIYVAGSRRHGSMGPTLASFRTESDAAAFAARHGGKVLRYAEVTPELADLSGGAMHDSRM